MATRTEDRIIGWDSPVLIHPGEHLLDFIENAGISQAELAERVGISKKAINEIIRGKAPITQNTAFRLSKVFPVSPDFWINLQSNYDLALARESEEERLALETQKYLPEFHETFKELSRIGVFSAQRWATKNYSEITKRLQHFFAVDSLAYVRERTMEFAFRKYDRKSLNHYTLAAWVQLGKIKAQRTEVAPFDKEKLRSSLPELKSFSRESWATYIPKLEKHLAECGIVLVLAPTMMHAPVQGATNWVDGDKVLIILKSEKQSEDKFWFNLFHEIGHVLLHGKKEVYVDFGEDGAKTEEEIEADNFAQKWLIPEFKEFHVEFKRAPDLETALKTFAQKNDVSPAIVAGRVTHELRDDPRVYAVMSPFLKERITYSNIITS